MATTDKLLVVKTKQRIRRGQEFRMEYNLYSIVHCVEQLAASHGTQHGIVPVVYLFDGKINIIKSDTLRATPVLHLQHYAWLLAANLRVVMRTYNA